MSSSLAWAAPIAKIAIAPTQVVSRKLRIGTLPATVPRVTDARAHAVPRVGTHSMGRLPAACHSATETYGSTYAPPGLRGYVRTPVTLTFLKPEAARSLFPRLIDRNQKRSTIIFRASPGCNEVIYSCCIEHRAPGCALAKPLFVKCRRCPLFAYSQMLLGSQHRKLRASGWRRGGRMNAGRRQTRRTKPHGQKQRTSPSACARLRSLVAALACSGDWNMVSNRPGTRERLKKPRERDRRGGHAYSP